MSVSFSPQPYPKVSFLGAAGTVTGSMHLLQWKHYNILLDCGLERDKKNKNKLEGFPFDAAMIDAVILSHNHSDHCGRLPELAKFGFRGQVYCTPPSKDLLSLVLKDAVHIQEKESPGKKKVFVPSETDAFSITERTVPIEYGEFAEIRPGLRLRFHEAGHILGSAITEIVLGNDAQKARIVYSGDLGRFGLPFLPKPAPIPPTDLLICESTYGGRYHDPAELMAQKLAQIFHDTIARGGKVLIPAFSLGRTQLLLYYLESWMTEGKLPRLPVFMDSPLAAQIGKVYRKHSKRLDVDWDQSRNFVHVLESWDEAQAASFSPDPCVIVASGGMCEGGRILQHLKNHLDDPRTSIVLVSFQAPGTLGDKLLEKSPNVYFHGKTWNKWAQIHELKGFSGHADMADFRTMLAPLAGSIKVVRLVHGEPDASKALAGELSGLGFDNVRPAKKNESIILKF
ncbi:MAG: MBL fold metallo-hydrolase [Planctomycetia bacterium]|jgi:metallo-beta-lactamase family protein